MFLRKSLLMALSFTFLLLLNCSSKEPVSDLADGRSGKIYFQSDNSTFKERFDRNVNAEAVKINGVLSLPKTKTDKVPAAILLHGMGGVTSDVSKGHITNLAKNLNDTGLATFIIDSQTPRDARLPSEVFSNVTLSMRVSDAYAALDLLCTHPKIDKNRIGVVGLSRGGNVALIAQSEKVRTCYVKDPEAKFSAVLLLYPSCMLRMQEWDLIKSPILMLLGEDDNITPTETSLAVANQLKEKDVDVKVTVFKEAYHAFDFKFFTGQKFEFFYDLTGCQDRYYILEEDGLVYSTQYKKKAEDARAFKYNLSECTQNKKGYLGGSKEARAKAVEAYKLFFKNVFYL